VKLSELSISELVVGTKIIYRNVGEGISYCSNIRESKIIEISPSRKYIKLADYGWTLLDNGVIDILEVLHA
jgi:hypothetical protein